ncbi:MAG: hypothetical protein AB4050_09160, partial [Synechococcus sp.]
SLEVEKEAAITYLRTLEIGLHQLKPLFFCRMATIIAELDATAHPRDNSLVTAQPKTCILPLILIVIVKTLWLLRDRNVGRRAMEKLASTKLDRRKFLENAGKIGVYTPPALMLLMYPSAEAIASNSSRWNEADARRRRRARRARRARRSRRW